MKRFFSLIAVCTVIFGITAAQPAAAATFRSGDTVIITDDTQNLEDVYLFGGTIRVDAPVTNDVVAAGGDIAVNENVTNSIIAAGGNISISGSTGNTVRIAGGNMRIDGDITRDLVAAGGSITVTQDATIGGDVVVNGGTINLDGPIQGNVIINGGNATLNSTVAGDVTGTIGRLTLGPNARINGNLTYSSEERANIAESASVSGETSFKPIEQPQRDEVREFITAGAIYKLVADIIISILLIIFFSRALSAVLTRITAKPVESGAIGFTFIFLFPLAALLFFILIWLGAGALLTYALVLLISLYITKIFAGWWLLHWWQGRNNKRYQLDWKAGVLGPVVLFLISFIPFIGWIAIALLFFVATGALIMQLIGLMRGQTPAPQKAAARKNK